MIAMNEIQEMNSSLAETELPEDLILEILVRLPTKTLIRFKAVCKRWKTLITNPNFTKSQFQICKKFHRLSSHLLLQYNSVFVLDLDVDDLINNPIENKSFICKFVPLHSKPFHLYNQNYYTVIGSCYGIICFRLVTEGKFCLWNPIINETRFVAYPDGPDFSRFDYNLNISLSVFGYAPSIDDYKILLVGSMLSSRTSVFVYSLRRNSWSVTYTYKSVIPGSVTSKSLDEAECYHMEDVVLNDALLFVMWYNSNPIRCKYYIAKFDMVNDCFELVADLPEVQENLLRLLQIKIGVIDDNKIVVCYVYRETLSGAHNEQLAVTRDVVEVLRLMLDQNGRSSSWEMICEYKGNWEVETEEVEYRKLIRITDDGKVLMFADTRFMGNWQILDISQHKPSLIHVNIEYCPQFRTHQTNYKAKYVPSLISPNSF